MSVSYTHLDVYKRQQKGVGCQKEKDHGTVLNGGIGSDKYGRYFGCGFGNRPVADCVSDFRRAGGDQHTGNRIVGIVFNGGRYYIRPLTID